VRVHLARKHALEFELLDLLGQAIDISLDFLGCPSVRLTGDQLQQFGRIAQGALEAIQTAHHLVELGAFPPKLLGTIWIVPDAGLLELALYFLQPL